MSETAELYGFGNIRKDDVEMVSDHLDHLRRRGLKQRTISTRVAYLGRLALEHPSTGLLEMTSAMIEDAIAAGRGHSGEGLSAASKLAYRSNLSGFYRWAQAAGFTSKNPAELAAIPSQPSAQPRPIAETDFVEMVALSPTAIIEAWLLLGGEAGLRCMEIASMLWSNVNFEERYIIVLGKRDTLRYVPMSDGVERSLRRLCERRDIGEDLMFYNAITGETFLPWQISRSLNDWMRSIGFGQYTAHQLRHRFATKLLDVTEDHRLAQTLLGHAKIDTLSVYAHVHSERKVEAIRKMSDMSDARPQSSDISDTV